MKISLLSRMTLALIILASLNISNAVADGEKKPANAMSVQADAMGKPGVAKNVARTILVTLADIMRFIPNAFSVKQAETVRVRIVNGGKIPHELVLGTPQEIDEHAAMMRAMPDMVHTDASSTRVAPDKSTDILWQFTKARKFQYVWLIAGHREAGMQGSATVFASVKK